MKRYTFRRLTSLLCAVMLVIGMLPLSVHAEYSNISDEKTAFAVSVLDTLGIVEGYPDGSFHPDDELTRAQFCKLAILLLGLEDGLTAASRMTIYSDVISTHWAAAYVNLASTQSLITGYGDGRFGPDDNVTFAQAVVITLRMLGYSESDIGTYYPDDYLNYAARLGLTDTVELAADEPLTRGQAAVMLVDMLSCENKSGKAFYESLAADVLTDVILLDENGTSPYGMLNAVKLYMNGQVVWYAHSENIDPAMIGLQGTALLDKHDRIFAFLPDGERYTVKDGILISANTYEDGKGVVRICTESGIAAYPRANAIASSLNGSSGTLLLNEYGYALAFLADNTETYKIVENAVLADVGVRSDAGVNNCAMFYANGASAYYSMSGTALDEKLIGSSGVVLYTDSGALHAFYPDGTAAYHFRYGVLVEKNVYNTAASFWDGETITRYSTDYSLPSSAVGSSGLIMLSKQGHVQAFIPDNMPAYSLSSAGMLALPENSRRAEVCLWINGNFQSYGASGSFTESMQGRYGKLLLDWAGDAVAFIPASTSSSRQSVVIAYTQANGLYYDVGYDEVFGFAAVSSGTDVIWNGEPMTWGDAYAYIGEGEEAVICYDSYGSLAFIVIG